MSEWMIHIVFSFLSTIGFGIITNIPRRAFVAAGFINFYAFFVNLISLKQFFLPNYSS